VNLKDLPVDIQQKVAGEIDVDGMSRIQFYPPDLAYRLRLSGRIADMHVDVEHGVQVLRMTIVPRQSSEYKTVYAPEGSVALPKPMRQPRPVKPEAQKKSFLDILIGEKKTTVKESAKSEDIEWI
jgi:hypothetical protein